VDGVEGFDLAEGGGFSSVIGTEDRVVGFQGWAEVEGAGLSGTWFWFARWMGRVSGCLRSGGV